MAHQRDMHFRRWANTTLTNNQTNTVVSIPFGAGGPTHFFIARMWEFATGTTLGAAGEWL
jgi:hypothetical protein